MVSGHLTFLRMQRLYVRVCAGVRVRVRACVWQCSRVACACACVQEGLGPCVERCSTMLILWLKTLHCAEDSDMGGPNPSPERGWKEPLRAMEVL